MGEICQYCGGRVEPQGSLGYREHFRCRDCGSWQSLPRDDVVESVNRLIKELDRDKQE